MYVAFKSYATRYSKRKKCGILKIRYILKFSLLNTEFALSANKLKMK